MNTFSFSRKDRVVALSLLPEKEVIRLKLECVKKAQLQELALSLGVRHTGRTEHIIHAILSSEPDERIIDEFIKEKYRERIEERQRLISDDELMSELSKVTSFSWGVVQGDLDRKIQREYVRKIAIYNELLDKVSTELHSEITNYVICTWFNHWTTVLIEEHIGSHPNVVPTLKSKKGIDLFFDGQPFDLKVTYLPRNYDPESAIEDPMALAKWMYENQGSQRFGDENRLFVVLFDKSNPAESWKLKRDFVLVFKKIDNFLTSENVSARDRIDFEYNHQRYSALSKILIVTNE